MRNKNVSLVVLQFLHCLTFPLPLPSLSFFPHSSLPLSLPLSLPPSLSLSLLPSSLPPSLPPSLLPPFLPPSLPQARLAQRYGCIALLIYSDPAEYAPKGGPPVYPNGTSLPPSGVQRGSLLITNGDPLTPGIPAIPGVYRRSYEALEEEEAVPRIPVQPISYGEAIHFMR